MNNDKLELEINKRRRVYLNAAKDLAKESPKHWGICYYLVDGNKKFCTAGGMWGPRSCYAYPEICLFAFDNEGHETGYFEMDSTCSDFDPSLLRSLILLFAHQITVNP